MHWQAFRSVALPSPPPVLFLPFSLAQHSECSPNLIQLDSCVSILQVEIQANILHEFSVQWLKEKQVIK